MVDDNYRWDKTPYISFIDYQIKHIRKIRNREDMKHVSPLQIGNEVYAIGSRIAGGSSCIPFFFNIKTDYIITHNKHHTLVTIAEYLNERKESFGRNELEKCVLQVSSLTPNTFKDKFSGIRLDERTKLFIDLGSAFKDYPLINKFIESINVASQGRVIIIYT